MSVGHPRRVVQSTISHLDRACNPYIGYYFLAIMHLYTVLGILPVLCHVILKRWVLLLLCINKESRVLKGHTVDLRFGL